jgi:hypothetical protein
MGARPRRPVDLDTDARDTRRQSSGLCSGSTGGMDPWAWTLDLQPVLLKHRRRAIATGDRATAHLARQGVIRLRRYHASLALDHGVTALKARQLLRAFRWAAVGTALFPPAVIIRVIDFGRRRAARS